jgi:hypothetical protein
MVLWLTPKLCSYLLPPKRQTFLMRNERWGTRMNIRYIGGPELTLSTSDAPQFVTDGRAICLIIQPSFD